MQCVRQGAPPSKEQLEAFREQAKRAADLIHRALVLRHKPLPQHASDSFMKEYVVVESALLSNPDEYSLWAFRREVLLSRMQSSSESSNTSNGPEIETPSPPNCLTLWSSELLLTMRALRNHPKAYPAWQHRLWLLSDAALSKYIPSRSREAALRDEQKLSELMLSKDPRNFHGWAHRMRVRSIQMAMSNSDPSLLDRYEYDFVDTKIVDDFANGSAWHHRSVLLPRIFPRNEMATVVRDELQLVRQAFFTEPEVQSVWFYYRWLLAGAPSEGFKVSIGDEILREELTVCDQLLELEPKARFGLQARAHILSLLKRFDEANETFETLKILDPMRKGYYSSMQTKQ